MKLFGVYIMQKRKEILIFFLFCVIFAVTFTLYRLPLGAVMYPALLCLLLGIIFLIVDFYRVRRKSHQLSALKDQAAALITDLPAPEGIEEENYQAIIHSLQTEISVLETQAANRYQDTVEYYTVWAHQIKTPIASMRLTLQNEDTPLARKLSSDLFRIEQYADMVLAFLRLDSVSSDYVFREYKIDSIVREAAGRFALEFIDRKLRLLYEPTDETVVTDDKWLSFVVEQLLSNALKYTRTGSIRIFMKEPKTLCIEDTGIGIAPEDLPRIFEKGYTGYNGRRDKRASGIGLYLCKRICRNLGIDISVTSVLDQGTTVQLRLDQYEINEPLTKM